jgi:hypothetical protein
MILLRPASSIVASTSPDSSAFRVATPTLSASGWPTPNSTLKLQIAHMVPPQGVTMFEIVEPGDKLTELLASSGAGFGCI